MVGRRIFGSQEPAVQIDQMSIKFFDNVFTKQKNIYFDCYTFPTRKQLKGEPVEKNYGCVIELSLSCDLGSHEELIIPDT